MKRTGRAIGAVLTVAFTTLGATSSMAQQRTASTNFDVRARVVSQQRCSVEVPDIDFGDISAEPDAVSLARPLNVRIVCPRGVPSALVGMNQGAFFTAGLRYLVHVDAPNTPVAMGYDLVHRRGRTWPDAGVAVNLRDGVATVEGQAILYPAVTINSITNLPTAARPGIYTDTILCSIAY